jgi:hypothetical protein
LSTEGAQTTQPRAERSAALGSTNEIDSALKVRYKSVLPFVSLFQSLIIHRQQSQGGDALCPGLSCLRTFGAPARL